MDSLQELNVTMSITNIGAQGYPGTGKTSLLDLAMGKDPAPTRISTGCVDPPSFYLMVESEGSDGVKWDHVTTEKMFDMVCEAVKQHIDENPSEKATVSTTLLQRDREQVSPTEDYVPTIPEATQSIPSSSLSSSSSSSLSSLSSPPPPLAADAGPSHFTYMYAWFSELLKKVRHGSSSGVIFNSRWMMVADSGGQPPFLDAAALFLQKSCLQIFSLKLNELLDEKPELQYFIDGKSACFAKSTLRLTNQQIMETLAKTLSAFRPPYTPSALESPQGAKFTIVGTFADEAHLCKETIEEKEDILEKVLKPYKPFQVRYGGKIILPINAVTTDKDERQQLAAKLQKLITRAANTTMKIRLKLSWFGFLLIMLNMSKEQKKSMLTLDECLEIGKFLGMKSQETQKAIHFFHDIGLIMHFDTPSLRKSVIVDAKPLLDMVSQLLSASFADEMFLADYCDLILPSEAKELLQQHGRFSRHTLKSFLNFNEPITLEFFLDVLEHVKAVAVIDGTHEYIMPCTLSYLPADQCVPHSSLPWVIRFRIRQGAEEVFIPLPVGYLPALIVFLLTRFSSQFYLNPEDSQFRNLVKLRYQRGGSVYIVEYHLQLEVYFTHCDELPGDCADIRSTVQEAMLLTEERLRITQCAITKIDSFLCSCDEKSNARHVCIYNNSSGIIECEVTGQSCNLEFQNLLWIKPSKIISEFIITVDFYATSE